MLLLIKNYLVARLLLLGSVRHEFQNSAIDAVALVRRGVESLACEDVAEVAVAGFAANFGARITHVVVGVGDDILRLRRIVK